MSTTPERAEQVPQEYPPDQPPLSDSSRRTFGRLAGISVLIATSLAALIAGIVIGSAARKRIDKLAHARF